MRPDKKRRDRTRTRDYLSELETERGEPSVTEVGETQPPPKDAR